MSSKKYKFLLGLITLMATTTFAQMGTSYSVFDSSVIPSKRLPQQNEFWNNTYNFPSKPRNMWEVGASLGTLGIGGDVTTKFPTLGFTAHVRKAFGYIFSMRLQYLNATGKGLNWQPALNYRKNEAWVSGADGGNLPTGVTYNPWVREDDGTLTTLRGGEGASIFYNYKTKVQDLSLQAIVTLNNVRFHKQKTGFTFYGGAGLGYTWYNARINALDASNQPYATAGAAGNKVFDQVFNTYRNNGFIYENRKDILKQLKAGMDNTYETAAESDGGVRRPKLGKNTLKPSGTVLAGIAFKLSNRVNLALEDRHTFVKTDLLDGQQWQEHAAGDAVLTRDY
ncbi:MAG: hypothetical protein RL172_2751, partial [Bacteroidota bacterium]